MNNNLINEIDNLIANEILNITEDETIARAIDESIWSSRPQYKNKISKKGFSKLKNEKYNKQQHLNEICPITLQDFSNN